MSEIGLKSGHACGQHSPPSLVGEFRSVLATFCAVTTRLATMRARRGVIDGASGKNTASTITRSSTYRVTSSVAVRLAPPEEAVIVIVCDAATAVVAMAKLAVS